MKCTSDTPKRYGAAPSDWDHFGALELGLTTDLLPVVSNPTAVVSEHSGMRQLGKTPSEYNREGKARGVLDWTNVRATQQQIDQWAQQADYGICIQTRDVRAWDIDVTDFDQAHEIAALIRQEAGALPARIRGNSAKMLFAFRCPGEFGKRSFRTSHGLVEWLAGGNQFIAIGTHPSGARYEWEGGLPNDIPTLSMQQAESVWTALEQRFAQGPTMTAGASTGRRRGKHINVEDPLLEHIEATGWVIDRARDGKINVRCPWEHEHTSGMAGDSSTQYIPAGYRGDVDGGFKCLHGHCAHRTTRAFMRAVGYDDPHASTAEEDFGDLDDGDDGGPDDAERGADAEAAATPRRFTPGDHVEISSKLWRDRFGGPAAPGLIRWNGDWYRRAPGGSHFTSMPVETLLAIVHRYLAGATKLTRDEPPKEVPFSPDKKATEEAVFALRTLCNLDRDAAPTWIRRAPEGYEGLRADELVAMANGLFHLPTRQLLPHTPHRFGLAALPYGYDPAATCPEWHRFLQSLWPDDRQCIDTLQEVLGYLASGSTRQQKAFFLIGPPRAGKGTILAVIEGLLGKENVAGPTLQSLSGQFGLASLVGKSAAVIGDTRGAGRDVQTTIERLLGISGNDVQTVERKNRTDWIGRLGVRFVIASNEVPKLPDASGALLGRMLILRTTQSFRGKEDTTLLDRLLQELPGILNWALIGLQRLEQRGRFIQPASSAEVIEQWGALGSQEGAFLQECCTVDPAARTPKDDLYGAYRMWARTQGIDHVYDLRSFASHLYAMPEGIKEGKTTGPRGSDRRPAFIGVRLVDEWAERVGMSQL